jgi:membrane-associated phospholipid phosphatase
MNSRIKQISRITLLFLLPQLVAQPLWAHSNNLDSDQVASFNLASDSQKETTENPPETGKKQDKEEEYAEHSHKAFKFMFTDLPRHLGYDIKDSFWGWGSLGFAVGIGMVAGLHTQDNEIQSSFSPHALFGNTGDDVFSQMGAPYTMAGVSILTTIVGAGIHDKKLTTTGESMIESLFWSELITIGLKYAFNRTRPDGSAHGFPSAHASGVFSTATVLEMMYGPKVGVPMYAFATLVAIARVDSFNHFPSDVLMGAVLGSVIGYGTARYHKKLHNNFTVTPDLGRDHYGLLLNHDF